MRILTGLLTIFVLAFSSGAVFAADAPAAAAATSNKGDLDTRLALARKMHEFRPVKTQVDKAIDSYVSTRPENEREVLRTAFQSVLNYEALEKISIDALRLIRKKS